MRIWTRVWPLAHRTSRVGLAIGVVSGAIVVAAGAYAFGPVGGGVAVEPRDIALLVVDASGAGASSAPATPSSAPAPSAPSPAASTAKPTPSKSPAGCPKGDKHREVEELLARIGSYGTVTVDGVQSDADCAAIKKFQSRFGISPANGRAGGTTADVARRIAQSLTAAERAKCGAGAGLTACVDLTLQTTWVVRDGAVIFGPTVVRTGMRGYATPAGTYKINDRDLKEWSNPYEVWLPYWQHFYAGMGFHQTTTYLHNSSIGSHGCVNLLRSDAVKLWTTIGYGTIVKIFGRRPGT